MDPDEDSPKKYIRTFAGDIEILQKGGTPDLTPLAESSAREKLVGASPIVEQPVPVPPPPSQGTAPQTPVYVPPPSANTPIETYSGDFSDRVKETQASTATVLAAEQDFGPRTIAGPQPRQFSRSSVIYSIAGAILLIAGIIGAALAYLHYTAVNAPVAPATIVSAPIFVDEREQISGTGTVLAQAIIKSVAHMIAQGSVRLLYLGDTSATDVFAELKLSVPDALLRNIDSAQSMAGVVNASGTQSPFFILSVASYGDTFAGMLSWERSMPRDLATLFPAYSSPISNATATSTLATSSPQATSPDIPAIAPTFHDEVIANHDVRVYRDAAGRSLFLYGYWNQSMLVIARDPSAFAEILQRLATSRTQP